MLHYYLLSGFIMTNPFESKVVAIYISQDLHTNIDNTLGALGVQYIFRTCSWGTWPWSYGSWIYKYLCHQCLSPLTLRVRFPRGVLNTTLCDQVDQYLAAGPNTFAVMTSIQSLGTLGSVASLLAATPFQGNPARNHQSLEHRINYM